MKLLDESTERVCRPSGAADRGTRSTWCALCNAYHADIDDPEPRGLFNGAPGAIVWQVMLLLILMLLAAAAWSRWTTPTSATERRDRSVRIERHGADTMPRSGERKGSPRAASVHFRTTNP